MKTQVVLYGISRMPQAYIKLLFGKEKIKMLQIFYTKTTELSIFQGNFFLHFGIFIEW